MLLKHWQYIAVCTQASVNSELEAFTTEPKVLQAFSIENYIICMWVYVVCVGGLVGEGGLVW